MTLDWPHTVFLSVATLTLGALIYTGHVPPAILAAVVTYLIPSPLKKDTVPS